MGPSHYHQKNANLGSTSAFHWPVGTYFAGQRLLPLPNQRLLLMNFQRPRRRGVEHQTVGYGRPASLATVLGAV